MRRLRGGSKKRRKSTRKGGRRKTARRAYEGLKRKRKSNKPRKRRSSGMKFPKFGGTLKKVAIGVGAAQLAGLAIGFVAPQLAPIAKPVAALAAGGIPGVAAELILDQGLLGNVMGIFTPQASGSGVQGL